MENPYLAIIGHGTTGKNTDGSDDIKRGVHLRWAFRREMGFPSGCFDLFRRESTMVCFDLHGVDLTKDPDNSPKHTDPLSDGKDPKIQKPKLASQEAIVTKYKIESLNLAVKKEEISIKLPEDVYRVSLVINISFRGLFTVVALNNGREVRRIQVEANNITPIRTVMIRATRIDALILSGYSVSLLRLCYWPCKSLYQPKQEWLPIGESICLPVCTSGDSCDNNPQYPDCDWMNIEKLLPDNLCIRQQYGGDNAKDLASVLRILTGTDDATPQANRMILEATEPDDCPPPGQKQPNIKMSALDSISIAALDPIIAKILGLYYLDTTVEDGKAYDYKIIGEWSPNTLWKLSKSLTFDTMPTGFRYLLNKYPFGELTLSSSVRPTILDKPSKSAGTNLSLGFVKTDDFDWNFPTFNEFPVSNYISEDNKETVEIKFQNPVGEVQVWFGQEYPNVVMEAWNDVRRCRVDSLVGSIGSVEHISDSLLRVKVSFQKENASTQISEMPRNLFSGKLLVQKNGNTENRAVVLFSGEGKMVNNCQGFLLTVLLSENQNASFESGMCKIEPAPSNKREDVLAVHAYKEIDKEKDKITRIVLKGSNFWIHKICWQVERIPFGKQTAYVFGQKLHNPNPLRSPSEIKAFSIPGMVQKVPDCQPLGEGETIDNRYSIGIRWHLPLAGEKLLPNEAVRYHIKRVNHAGVAKLLTENAPKLVGEPSPTVRDAIRKYQPAGLSKEFPFVIDYGLEPGSYKYSVAGVDVFGRVSEYSKSTDFIDPIPPAPPPPTNLQGRFIDRLDARLSSSDKATLPEEINESIVLRWRWPAENERMSPDVQKFNIFYKSGPLNVLAGEITKALGEDESQINCLAKIDSQVKVQENILQENVLAGCLLYQGGKSFRILSHDQGNAHGVILALRTPPSPSENGPEAGDCIFTLDSPILVEIIELQPVDGKVQVQFRTNEISEKALWRIKNGYLNTNNLELKITEESSNGSIENGYVQVVAYLEIPNNVEGTQPTIPSVPFFAWLRLPPPDGFPLKDYSLRKSWEPPEFSTFVPKNQVGEYTLTIRTGISGETPGLKMTQSGSYILVVDKLPPGLDVGPDNLRREGYFGISSEGLPIGDRLNEGPVSLPAKVSRIYRGKVDISLEMPLSVDNIYATQPNFNGKSTHTFSWQNEKELRFEVYRALDETLFKIDAEVRKQLKPDGTLLRSRNQNDYFELLKSFQGYEGLIQDFIIEPFALDLEAIERSNYKNILLQALASLPLNERAFTRLGLDDKHLWQDASNNMNCIDDTLDGRAEGRYFYRVKAFDSVNNPSPMSISTSSVYVRGDLQPAMRVTTRVENGGRKISIHWTLNQKLQGVQYHIYRADKEEAACDVRLMKLAYTESNTLASSWTDSEVVGSVTYYYRLVAEDSFGNKSAPSQIVAGRAYQVPPESPIWLPVNIQPIEGGMKISLTWEHPRFAELSFRIEKQNYLINALGQPGRLRWDDVSGWLDLGVDTFEDVITEDIAEVTYRVETKDSLGQVADEKPEIIVDLHSS